MELGPMWLKRLDLKANDEKGCHGLACSGSWLLGDGHAWSLWGPGSVQIREGIKIGQREELDCGSAHNNCLNQLYEELWSCDDHPNCSELEQRSWAFIPLHLPVTGYRLPQEEACLAEAILFHKGEFPVRAGSPKDIAICSGGMISFSSSLGNKLVSIRRGQVKGRKIMQLGYLLCVCTSHILLYFQTRTCKVNITASFYR